MLPVRNKFRIDYDESDFSRSSGFIPRAPKPKKPIENPELSFDHLDRIKMNNTRMLAREMILAAINAIEHQPEFLHVARGTPDVLQNCPGYLEPRVASCCPRNMCSQYFGEDYQAIIPDISKGLQEMNQYLWFVGNRITFFNRCHYNSGVSIILDDDPHDTSELSDPNICRIGVIMKGSLLPYTMAHLVGLVLRGICVKVLLTQDLVACDPIVASPLERRERCHELARSNPELAIKDTSCWISFIEGFSNIYR
ncbi:MAG: hypothetical protein KAH18_02460 [Psychromonas sp.]|nr:hypothetical protein [Psychromonas sp.]